MTKKTRRLVVVTMSATYPPRRGNQIRTAELLGHLGDGWQIDSFSLTIQRTDLPLPRKRVRVSDRWTDWRSRDPLVLAWMSALARLGYPPVFVDRILPMVRRRRLRRALAGADVVWVAPPYHFDWVRRLTPAHVPVILDEQGIEADMYPARGSSWSARIAAEVRRAERAAFAQADLVMVTCQEDGEEARGHGGREVALVANGVDLRRFRPVDARERLRLRGELGLACDALLAVFVGSGHPPNVRALEVLEAQAGAYADVGVQIVAVGRASIGRPRADNVVHVGEVADVAVYLQAADIALCPLLTGSGTSIKTIEYLAAGLPLVSTATGVRGLEVRPGVDAEVCPVEEMPSRVADLATTPSRRIAMAIAGRRLAEERYGWDGAGRAASAALTALCVAGEQRLPTVLFVASGSELYGSDVALLRMATAHTRRGGGVLVALPDDGPLAGSLRSAGVDVVVTPLAVIRRRLMNPAGVAGIAVRLARPPRGLRDAARTARVDVVHSNTSVVLSGAVLARRLGVPHVWHMREDITAGRRIALFDVMSRNADVIVATSGWLRDAVAARRPALASRVRVVRDGVDLSMMSPLPDRGAARRHFGLDPERPVLAMLARIKRYKGQTLLVEAVRRLGASAGDVQLLLAGDVYSGDERHLEELRNDIARAGLGERVRLPGFCAEPQLVLAAADLLVAPSTTAWPEGYGLAVVDALCAGVPVIASAHGGHLEIVRDGVDGLLVPPDDVDALAGAIRRMLDDADLRHAMARAALRDRARFAMERGHEELRRIYEEVTGRGA
jgi:glycosyltransferase involved in cell wall biosynthesis